jgi:molybdate transport system substrate-binding protein
MAGTTRSKGKKKLHVLCAGAVQGLVRALQAPFGEATGAEIDGRFGAVGAMKEALMAGAPCDVLIVADAMLRALQANRAIEDATTQAIGRVRTGVAVHEGEAMPDVHSVEALKAAFLAAPAIYVPDIEKSTAGQHVASVLDQLGVRSAVAAKLVVFANGATAMTALANRSAPGSIGCTQVTEILYTPFLALAGTFPEPFGLSTLYSAGLSATSTEPTLAATFIAMLCGPQTASLRRAGGFDPVES